jgi:hypothetical protein
MACKSASPSRDAKCLQIHRRDDKPLHPVTGRERSENPLYLCLLFHVDEKLDTICWLDGAAATELWNLMTFIPEEWKPLMA